MGIQKVEMGSSASRDKPMPRQLVIKPRSAQWIMDNAPDVPKLRSPFHHELFFCVLCAFHRNAENNPASPLQWLYDSKSMMHKVLECAFMQAAREIDLLVAATNGQMAELQAKIHLTQVD